jgi:DNA-binding CsgD family transcriptional regulator
MEGVLKQQILKLRNEGHSYKNIKNLLKCSSSTISYYCKKFNLNLPVKNRLVTEDEVIKMNLFYEEGKSFKDIALLTGRSTRTISLYIKSKRKPLSQAGSKGVIDWRKRVKLKLVDYKGGKCEICGYCKSLWALEFHHRDPELKDFTISSVSKSFYKLKKEVDKCMLVCSNCHAELHEKLSIK